MLTFWFGNISDSGTGPGKYRWTLGLDAPFLLVADQKNVLFEPLFPIVELYECLWEWFSSGSVDDFVYTSLEADEEGLVEFRRVGEDKGSVWSAWTLLKTAPILEWSAIVQAASGYMRNLEHRIAAEYGICLSEKVERWSAGKSDL